MKLGTAVTMAASCVAATLWTQAAFAGTWNFAICNGSQFGSGTAAGSQTGAGSVGNVYACAANGSVTRDLNVSAWGPVSTGNNTFGAAYVTSHISDGFGVASQSEGGIGATSPNDSLDNDPTNLVPNLILLHFSSAVILSELTLGWSTFDADLTIMAYTGAGTPASFLDGKTSSNLTSGGGAAGWSLVENVGDAAPDFAYATSSTNVGYNFNVGGISAAYWLVSAYAADFGGGALDSVVDYVHLLSVTTRSGSPYPEPEPVPEPATLSLLAFLLLLLWGPAPLRALLRPARGRERSSSMPIAPCSTNLTFSTPAGHAREA